MSDNQNKSEKKELHNIDIQVTTKSLGEMSPYGEEALEPEIEGKAEFNEWAGTVKGMSEVLKDGLALSSGSPTYSLDAGKKDKLLKKLGKKHVSRKTQIMARCSSSLKWIQHVLSGREFIGAAAGVAALVLCGIFVVSIFSQQFLMSSAPQTGSSVKMSRLSLVDSEEGGVEFANSGLESNSEQQVMLFSVPPKWAQEQGGSSQNYFADTEALDVKNVESEAKERKSESLSKRMSGRSTIKESPRAVRAEDRNENGRYFKDSAPGEPLPSAPVQDSKSKRVSRPESSFFAGDTPVTSGNPFEGESLGRISRQRGQRLLNAPVSTPEPSAPAAISNTRSFGANSDRYGMKKSPEIQPQTSDDGSPQTWAFRGGDMSGAQQPSTRYDSSNGSGGYGLPQPVGGGWQEAGSVEVSNYSGFGGGGGALGGSKPIEMAQSGGIVQSDITHTYEMVSESVHGGVTGGGYALNISGIQPVNSTSVSGPSQPVRSSREGRPGTNKLPALNTSRPEIDTSNSGFISDLHALGGEVIENRIDRFSSVPVLGDVPVTGNLFSGGVDGSIQFDVNGSDWERVDKHRHISNQPMASSSTSTSTITALDDLMIEGQEFAGDYVEEFWDKDADLSYKSAGPEPVKRNLKSEAAKDNVVGKLSAARKNASLAKKPGGTMLAELEEEQKFIPPVYEYEPFPEVETGENAFASFSLNVNDVSYQVARASLGQGSLPDPNQIRSEEFINALDYGDPRPSPEDGVAIHTERALHPFESDRQILRVGIQTAFEGRDITKPMNLTLVLDTSGSMERPDRVAVIRGIVSTIAESLSEKDRVTIIGFSRVPTLWGDAIPGNQNSRIMDTLNSITPSGGTNIGAALDLAYSKAQQHFIQDGNNRILFMTDGAANLGEVNPGELKKKVDEGRMAGVALDCFGVGWDGFDDTLLEEITRNSNGTYGFLNNPDDSVQYFKNRWLGSINVAASDVKVQVEFNPDRVQRYRQMGYLKHRLTKQQFYDDSVDAAEIPEAEDGQAIFIFQSLPDGNGPIGWVRVRYREPETGEVYMRVRPIAWTGAAPDMQYASPALKLAYSSGAFAEKLASNPFAEPVELATVQQFVQSTISTYPSDRRPGELLEMIRMARSLNLK